MPERENEKGNFAVASFKPTIRELGWRGCRKEARSTHFSGRRAKKWRRFLFFFFLPPRLALICRRLARTGSVATDAGHGGYYTADVCAMTGIVVVCPFYMERIAAHFKRIPPCRIKGARRSASFTITIMSLLFHPFSSVDTYYLMPVLDVLETSPNCLTGGTGRSAR